LVLSADEIVRVSHRIRVSGQDPAASHLKVKNLRIPGQRRTRDLEYPPRPGSAWIRSQRVSVVSGIRQPRDPCGIRTDPGRISQPVSVQLTRCRAWCAQRSAMHRSEVISLLTGCRTGLLTSCPFVHARLDGFPQTFAVARRMGETPIQEHSEDQSVRCFLRNPELACRLRTWI
jgi:hypothetical protein